MQRTLTKNKMERVVKPLKAVAKKIIAKKTDSEKPVDVINVVDADGVVVKTFHKSEFGPRFVFKATQFAQNHSTLDNPLTIE